MLRGYAEKQQKRQKNNKNKFLIHHWTTQRLFNNNFQKLLKTKKKSKNDIKNYGAGMEQKIPILNFWSTKWKVPWRNLSKK